MKMINNKLIVFGFILFTFLAFGSMAPKANAYYFVGFVNGNYIGCETDLGLNGEFLGCGHHTNYPTYTTTTLNNVVGNNNQTNNSTNSNANTSTNPRNAAAGTATKNTVNNTTTNKTTNTSTNGNSLSANALFGANGFLPNTFVQWILLIVLVLLIVFVWRKISGANQKYHESPMKHA